jgi:hypothetical protein
MKDAIPANDDKPPQADVKDQDEPAVASPPSDENASCKDPAQRLGEGEASTLKEADPSSDAMPPPDPYAADRIRNRVH